MLQITLFLDLSLVIICIFLLFRHGDLAFTHPGAIYLIFHLLVFTFRLVSVLSGAPTLFSDQTSIRLGWEAVTVDEIIRAALIADVALLVMTIA